MSIKVYCAGCDRNYLLDDKFAGRKVTCKKCGQALQLPEAEAGLQPPQAGPEETVGFPCDGCGKTYRTPSRLAGKKIVCKECGETIVIPARATPARSAAPAGPPALDLYGFDDDPSPAGSTSRAVPDDGIVRDTGGETDALPRPGDAKPLSEAKKKQIAKRAAKADRAKPSYGGATYGVSFGAVLFVALLGFRVYRTVNRFSRAADRMNAASAPVDLSPRALAAAEDEEAVEALKQPGVAEARGWLDPVKYPNHATAGLSTEAARAMVAGFYERGAESVHVLDSEPTGASLVAVNFAVKLPVEPDKRKQCLEWQARTFSIPEPTADVGQKYLLITTY